MEFEDDEYIENRKKKEIKLKEYENRKLEIYKQQQQKNLQEQENSDLDLKYDLSYHNNRGYLKMKKPTYKGSSSNLINTKKTTTNIKLQNIKIIKCQYQYIMIK
ncbi:hypothetical protein PPERSA_03232 [Pseudocohnilembus persalinus]|uniref:Uncharacterized protein n=1 Tax=Pseudocohnilembus persalinus TaxID=266149 RepID=A0A0V0QYL3_PSEPJ|nr:hypothetical protein PPERSA_03232 [Pseudocohnilembus persalinus]|eukprot:KRX07399.1 hypothetical protein PPERSA_03232 [Pseudocohnilembus persalinus]